MGATDVVVQAVLEDLGGWWFASDDDELTSALLTAGCRVVRRGHLMNRSLAEFTSAQNSDLPAAAEALRIRPLDVPASALVEVSLAAYPPGHIDAETQDPVQVEKDVHSLLSGAVIGPLLPASRVVLDQDRIVAVAIINRMLGESPSGGPWVSEICRDPSPRYAGLGSLLLTHVMVALAGSGETSLGLAVTEGNPAQAVYERMGFALAGSFRKVSVPARSTEEAR